MVIREPRKASRFVRIAARVLHTQEHKIEVWTRLILTSFLAALAVSAIHAWHLTDGIDSWWLDLLANVDRPKYDAPVTVVDITNDDYYDPDLFGGMSPLDPGTLALILGRVLEHRPGGVIMDIQIHPGRQETAERATGRLRLYRLLENVSAAGRPPIVLIRDVHDEGLSQATDDSVWAAWTELTSNPRIYWADPTIAQSGGVVRSVPLVVDTPGTTIPMPRTVLAAAIEAFSLSPLGSTRGLVAEPRGPTAPWRIRFTGAFLEDASALTPRRISTRTLLNSPYLEGQGSMLTGRIVLIGGSYYSGRDLQPTPVGRMAGVFVWAEAIASWIRQDAPRDPPAPITFGVEFLIGIAAGLLLVRFGPARGLLLSLLVIGPFMVVLALPIFGNSALFVSFLPSFTVVYLQYQVELFRKKTAIAHLLRTMDSRQVPTPDVSGSAEAVIPGKSVRTVGDPPPPYDGPGDYIFVSYKREDMPEVAAYLAWLGERGYRPWYDRGIPGGAEWCALIEEKVRGCRALIVFLSQAAVDSRWVRREVSFADGRGKPILAIKLGKLTLHSGLELLLNQNQILDAGAPDFEDDLRCAMEHIRCV